MKISDYIDHRSEWIRGEGPESDIVMSTRVRLARNLRNYPFFAWANDTMRKGVLEKAISVLSGKKFYEDEFVIHLKDTTDIERVFLVERHLISTEHAQDVEYKGLFIANGEMISIMINEEDHLRMQILQSGFSLMDAWSLIDDIDTRISGEMDFAYSNKFGYLTACPTNTGTGLRSSVMMHLPALEMTGQIQKVYDAISKVGFTIRGFYGEGTEASGNFFQISNQVALGHSEMDILDNFGRVIEKIISREKETREFLLANRKKEISDRVFRSLGTLKTARIITSRETIRLLSSVRMGVDLGLINEVDMGTLNDILLLMQPAHLQILSKRNLNPHERDIKRADLVRKKLQGS